MDNQLLENAVDDISLIRGIIDKTRKSFTGFSKIFILWGVLFLFMSLLHWIQGMNIEATIEFYGKYQFLVFAIPILLIILATIIYRKVVKEHPLIGLERHLMVLWILILFLQAMPARITILNGDISSMTTMITTTNNFSIVVFGLGIALAMTAVLTELRHFYYLAGIYFALAVIHGFFYIGSLIQILSSIGTLIVPFTLIYTGIYLKRYHERSEVDGAQLDS